MPPQVRDTELYMERASGLARTHLVAAGDGDGRIVSFGVAYGLNPAIPYVSPIRYGAFIWGSPGWTEASEKPGASR